ncbi:hypothetical protein Mterra_01365 [Calidithermus terrae]|uniref:Uncharacterized protein n=2 Tax=Calidithermus terrae TaxID=1408545 RepID=A0A399ERW3_9DEIN|nr:hypothetical protein Mterra_01365 [Calidithermus terrae]
MAVGRCFVEVRPSLGFHQTRNNLLYVLANAGVPEEALPLKRLGPTTDFLGWPVEGIAHYIKLAKEKLNQ